MLFGGSGGQDFFQKLTWILGAIILFGSLGLSLLKVKYLHESRPQQYKAPMHIPEPKKTAPAEENID
jgi:preprotein translocase subunit SecG